MKQEIPPRKSKLFEELLLKSWWVILCFLICFFTYDQAVKQKEREELKLRSRLEELVLSKEKEILLNKALQEEIASRDDPCWIELRLKEKLGLVPEGQTKVIFVPSKAKETQGERP